MLFKKKKKKKKHIIKVFPFPKGRPYCIRSAYYYYYYSFFFCHQWTSHFLTDLNQIWHTYSALPGIDIANPVSANLQYFWRKRAKRCLPLCSDYLVDRNRYTKSETCKSLLDSCRCFVNEKQLL